MSNKQTYLIFFLIIVILFSIYLISFRGGHDWGDDFAAYIDQSRAIVDGNLEEIISVHKYRYENSPLTGGPIVSPWGFAILLSPIYYVFGLDILPMKIYVSLFFIASLIVFFLLIQDRLSNIDKLLLIALIAFNRFYFIFKEVVHPDIPFLLFSLLSLFLIKEVFIFKKIWINKLFSYSFIGFLIFLSVEIRSIGYVLLPTLLVVQFIESKASIKKIVSDWFNYVPYINFFVLSAIRGLVLPSVDFSGYFFQGFTLKMILKNVFHNIKLYTLLPSKFFLLEFDMIDVFSQNNHWLLLLLYGILLLFVVYGIIVNIKKDYIFFAYVFFTLTTLIIDPSFQGYRYYLPIFPFFIYFLFAGLLKITLPLSVISDKLRYLNINAAHALGAVFLMISLFHISHMAKQNITFNRTEGSQGPYSADSVEMFDYIKRNTDKDAVFDFKKPRAFSLYTDRKCVATHTLDQLVNSPADYFVYIKEIPWWYQTDVLDYSKNLKCIFENKTFLLCELKQRPRSH